MDAFKKAYKNADLVKLREYISRPQVIPMKKFMNYVETSFTTNREVYDILVLILLNQYDLNNVTIDIINRDNIDLMESIFSYNTELVLDHERLIPLTYPKGRISMAKLIYEYNHGNEDIYEYILNLLKTYEFIYDEDENSIDSFILAMFSGNTKHAKSIIPYINPSFWNDFAIKFACDIWNIRILRKLLSYNEVDPGVDNNYALKISISGDRYSQVNELLKHPLVSINDDDMDTFIFGFIRNNNLCAIEKILRSNNNTILFFKKQNIIQCMIQSHNDITYLAIKLGIFDVSELINEYPNQERIIKKYLRNFKIDDPYICKPYEFNLDPIQIFESAIENDDLDLAKTIINYPISIIIDDLVPYLEEYYNTDNSVIDYIYDKILITYNPHLLCCFPGISENLFKKIFNTIVHNPDLDLEYLYKKMCHERKSIILKYIKKNYSVADYNKFL